jgi:hypothetical protein
MSEPRAAYNVDLPPDLNHAIMTILTFHTSSRNPISPVHLCAALKGFKVSDNQDQDRIKHLRRSGHLIGSTSGDDAGYYLITTPKDLEEYLNREYLAKMKDMLAIVEELIKSASNRSLFCSIKSKLM